MNFIDKIKKILGIKYEELGIVNPAVMFEIPDRSYFGNNEEIMKQIDSYKEEYSSILKRKKFVNSKEFSSEDLKNEVISITAILLQNFKDTDSIVSLSSERRYINYFKYKMYFTKYRDFYKDTLLRLCALVEVRNEELYYKFNKDCLDEEINSLSCIYSLFNSQRRVLENVLDKYYEVIIDDEKEIDNNYVDERFAYLVKVCRFFGIELSSSLEENKIVSCALMEGLLEKYVFEHHDVVKRQIKKVNDYSKGNLECISIDEINFITESIRLFHEFGREIVTSNDLEKAFNLKFRVYTRDINDDKCFDFTDISDEELQYYCNLISEKISDIFSSNNMNFVLTFKDKTKDALEVFSKFLKEPYNQFDYKKILGNKKRLAVLLSFDEENGFYNLLLNYQIRFGEKDSSVKLYENLCPHYVNGIYHDDNISLWCCLFLENLVEKQYNWDEISSMGNDISRYKYYKLAKDPLYKLYRLLYEVEKLEGFVYYPEGIVLINDNKTFDEDDLVRFNYFGGGEFFTPETLILPESLKRVEYAKFNWYKKVVFNEGIEDIGYCNFSKNSSIVIPSTVRNICNRNFLSHDKLDDICFNNYEESLLLNNKELFTETFRDFFDVSTKDGDSFSYSISPKCHSISFNDGEISFGEDELVCSSEFDFSELHPAEVFYDFLHSKLTDRKVKQKK